MGGHEAREARRDHRGRVILFASTLGDGTVKPAMSVPHHLPRGRTFPERLFFLCFLFIMTGSRLLADPIAGVSTSTTGFVGMAAQGGVGTPTFVTSYGDFEQIFGGIDPSLANPYLAPSVLAFFQNGGARAYIVRVADASDEAFIGQDGGGIEALRAVDEVSLLCAPGAASDAVGTALLRQCEVLGDRFAVLDTVPEASPGEALAQRERLRSAGGRGALYYPWLELPPDLPFDGILPPCGFVAGLYARVDVEQGVWTAPAGEPIFAPSPHRTVTPSEQETLNSGGVSVIRSFPGRGVLVWGARTIEDDPEYRYVNVRRLLIFLEESLEEGLEWAVFEPNDEPLWARIRSCVESFLLGFWRAGAFQGSTSSEAFFARADRTTMTAQDIADGRTVIIAGVAALGPSEFTIFRVVLERSAPAPSFRRGDVNGDGAFDISDPTAILGFLFLGAPAPGCLKAADLNSSGVLDLSDAIYALTFLFLGGPPPPGPFDECGTEPVPTDLDCGSTPCP